ncbi:MAG: LacI family DNA-binding transcriptional regulator [Verrucomicrobia bacterium]|nr:LacI family DNA-binding transcriptional regulator [Verrucomicrobiota bacterium]
MVRLKDIAERVGVSVMTVSRVLRESPDISEKTRARVLAAAKELGYVPDATARGLRTGKTRLWGLVVPGIDEPAGAALASSVEAKAFAEKFELFIADSRGDPEKEREAVYRILSRRVEGIVLAPAGGAETLQSVCNLVGKQPIHLAVVSAEIPDPRPGAAFVEIVFDDAMEALARRLHTLGHQRLGILKTGAWMAEPLAAAARRAAEAAGLAAREETAKEMRPEPAEIARAAERLCLREPKCSALLAVDDLAALQAGTALERQGLKVSKGVSVASCGGTVWTEFAKPALSAIRIPWREAADEAAGLLRAMLEEEAKPSLRRIRAEFIERESLGAPSTG